MRLRWMIEWVAFCAFGRFDSSYGFNLAGVRYAQCFYSLFHDAFQFKPAAY